MLSSLKRLVVGAPLASSEEQHQRLGIPTALAVFASDAISSTAYATEEILLVLVPVVGLGLSLNQLVPLALVVMVLLVVVISSYRQVIYAYPNGGGSYVVSRENLGETPSLLAGAALLVDYTLTVAVSISAGVAAITSAFPALQDQRVLLCVAFVALMAFANLRGLRESGRLFAGPTYVYVVILAALILYGLYRVFFGDLGGLPPNTASLEELDAPVGSETATLGVLLLLRAFSSGAVALTGVEAISNGVPTFRKPESRNASITLIIMGTILASFFFGISVLANHLEPTVSESETLLSILGNAVFGGGFLYYVLQFATFAILVLAANTAFNGFPQVSSIIAADGFLPRQLASRGDRLVFSNGIVLLAAAATGLIVAFGGVTTALIPLYAVGVFTGFTLSQVGMVMHHRTEREPGWQRNQVVNGLGALATFAVLFVVVVSKFAIGAWIPVVVIPLIVVVFKAIHRHYHRVAGALAVPDGFRARRHTHTVVVLVGRVHRGVLEAITYARSLTPDRLIALSVVANEVEQDAIEQQWAEFDLPVQLVTVFSPYRELSRPVLAKIDDLDDERPDDIITVVVPEFVLDHWWEQLLHNQSALVLRARLRMRPNTVVVAVPIHLHVGDVLGGPAAAASTRGRARRSAREIEDPEP
ncbi:APC family permease [soil metagenome]